MSQEKIENKGKSGYQKVIDQIIGLFLPIINYLTAASIIKSVLVLLANIGIISTAGGLYQLLFAVSDGFFYFLPVFLAITASKQWKTDPFISLLIPVAMLYPDVVAVLEHGQNMSFLGIPVQATVYHSSVLPVLMGVGLLYFVEKPCDRFIPEAIRGFVKPIVCCLIVIPVTFIVFGPVGAWIGNGLTAIFNIIYAWNQTIAGIFMGFFIQPMVVVGAQWSIVPVCINNISNNGFDVVLPLLGAAVYGQTGAALAMALLYKKNPKQRMICLQAALSGALGVTEPVLFGVTVPMPRAMIAACLAGGIGGGIAGFAGTHCNAFAFPSFVTCVAYVGPGFAAFLISMVVGLILGFVFTILQKKQIERIIAEQAKQ